MRIARCRDGDGEIFLNRVCQCDGGGRRRPSRWLVGEVSRCGCLYGKCHGTMLFDLSSKYIIVYTVCYGCDIGYTKFETIINGVNYCATIER